MAPPATGLIPIGEKLVEKALKNLLEPEFVMARTRDPKVYKGGIPFLVEVGIAYGGNIDPQGTASIYRYANRVPLLYEQSACALTKSSNGKLLCVSMTAVI